MKAPKKGLKLKRPQLVDDWRQCHRWASVRAAGALVLLSALQAEVLPLIQFAIPPRAWPWVSAGFGIAIALLRLWKQSLDDAPAAPQDKGSA